MLHLGNVIIHEIFRYFMNTYRILLLVYHTVYNSQQTYQNVSETIRSKNPSSNEVQKRNTDGVRSEKTADWAFQMRN